MSIQSSFAKILIRASGLKRKFGSEQGMRQFVAHRRPKHEMRPPRKLTDQFSISEYQVAERRVYHLQPRDYLPAKHVLYLHGGAYVNPIVWPHWNFINRLMRSQPCQVTVPLYGLAPEHTYQETFHLLTQLYRKLLEKQPAENFTFMGDSSGGGLALAFAQMLLEMDLPQPGKLVLLSPWLDITGSNPELAEIEKRDPLLAVSGSREAGRMWAGGVDPRIPLLSPIYGPLKGLAPICVLTGTDDMLLADAHLLRDKAKAQGQPLLYLEYQSMFHAWMLVELPESKRAMQDIVGFMNDASALST